MRLSCASLDEDRAVASQPVQIALAPVASLKLNVDLQGRATFLLSLIVIGSLKKVYACPDSLQEPEPPSSHTPTFPLHRPVSTL